MYFSLSKKSSPSYRRDIDGLRGIAVLLVLAFHLGTSKCSGGFIGVDVFFVISGYLISSIILSEISASRFSLLSFYERRIRRIAPALFVMMLVTSLLAYKFFLPAELEQFAKSLLASTFSISNLYFFHQSGYFEGPAAMKPLLHTWSLAVEEQFYIFLPLFLIAVRRFFPDRQRMLILSVAIASFCVSVWGAFHDPSRTFYLAHSRAWELLLGTLITLDMFPRFSNAIWRNAASMAGLSSILLAAVIYDRTTPFPGAAALVPCLGAALIIAAGRSGPSIVSRLLSLSPIVFVGMISYSLYLWHWPMIVFQGVSGILVQGIWPKAAKFVVLAASLLLATLSWKFVEQPFRDRRFTFSRPVLFRIAAACAVAFLVLGASALATRGFPSRFPPEAVRVATFLENADPLTESEYRVGTCFLTSRNPQSSFDPSVCLRQDPGKRNELLIGDSHAAQLWHGLSSVFTDINLMQATASGCKPTLDQPLGADKRCRLMMDYVFHDYLQSHHVDALLIAARWDGSDLPRLERTVDWLKHQGITIVLFGPTVQYDSALPRLLALAIQKNDPRLPADHRVPYYERLDQEMSQLAERRLQVRYISYFKLLCQRGSCLEYAAEGVPLQSDYGHLTGGGSALMAAKIRDAGSLNWGPN
jgi:peptidoglycan/LPS O-acetylase OafA/YrhL